MDKLTQFAHRLRREPATCIAVLLDNLEDDLGLRMPHDAIQLSDWWRKPNLVLQEAGWKFQSFDDKTEMLFFVRTA